MFRVVWGLSVTMETFSPTRELTRVDFPEFGRPTIVTKPDRPGCSGIFLFGFGLFISLGSDHFHSQSVNSAAICIQHLDGNFLVIDLLSSGRKPTEQFNNRTGHSRAFGVFDEWCTKCFVERTQFKASGND